MGLCHFEEGSNNVTAAIPRIPEPLQFVSGQFHRVASVKSSDSRDFLNRSGVMPETPPRLRKALRSTVSHQSSVISGGGGIAGTQ